MNNCLWILEIFCYCAIDIFGMISGYLLSYRAVKSSRIIKIWVQVVFYNVIIAIVALRMGIPVPKRDIIGSICPIILRQYWYLSAYFIYVYAIY